jgi:hypothetical protein
MKIIRVDNHDRDTVADSLWLDGIPDDPVSLTMAKRVCDRLNQRLGDGPGTHYILVKDDRRLRRGMEDCV